MTFKLQEFITSVSIDGIARTHSYEVIITPPPGLSALSNDLQKLITLRCSEVQLPEIDFQILPYYKKVIGPGEQRVTGINQYKIIPMEFIVDGNMRVRQFFENWMQYIANYDDQSNYSTIGGDQLPYELAYKDEYVATIDIRVYPMGLKNGDGSDMPKIYTLYNAYPVNMGNVGLGWGNIDRNMVLPIGFAYDRIKMPTMVTAKNIYSGL